MLFRHAYYDLSSNTPTNCLDILCYQASKLTRDQKTEAKYYLTGLCNSTARGSQILSCFYHLQPLSFMVSVISSLLARFPFLLTFKQMMAIHYQFHLSLISQRQYPNSILRTNSARFKLVWREIDYLYPVL